MEKKKRFEKVTNLAAEVINKNDEFQEKADLWLRKTGKKAGQKLRVFFGRILAKMEDKAALLIVWHDNVQMKLDRHRLIMRYKIASYLHDKRKAIAGKSKRITSSFAIIILVVVASVVVYNHGNGYSYAYNGKTLGYVKNQEDVVKILDMVSEELTKEHGANINIDKESDITFDRVRITDKEVDGADTVLKRLTYMTNVRADGYAIYIDGTLYGVCATKTEAQLVLDRFKEEYMPEKEKTEYEQVKFKENVEIKKTNVKLPNIGSMDEVKASIETGAQKEEIYTVKSGDTYYEICEKFDTTMKELKELNPTLKESSLHRGDKIKLSNSVSALTVVTVEKSTFAETVEFKTKYKESSSMYEGDSQVEQNGANGKRVVTARITRENGKQVDRQDLQSSTIKEPVTKIIIKGTKPRPKTLPTGTFIIPVSGYSLTSEYGWRWGRMHDGVDLACPTGTTIRASDGGTVIYAGWYSGYGLFIEVSHGSGVTTRYGHCSAINVSVGEKVYQGQKIGEVGNTGNSYGSHCHWEIKINGSTVNPLAYV